MMYSYECQWSKQTFKEEICALEHKYILDLNQEHKLSILTFGPRLPEIGKYPSEQVPSCGTLYRDERFLLPRGLTF